MTLYKYKTGTCTMWGFQISKSLDNNTKLQYKSEGFKSKAEALKAECNIKSKFNS